MANPKLENGYLRIPNELWEAICRIRIPGEPRQVLDVIIRKTIGFNKPSDWIPLSQIKKMTGIKKPNIVRALNKLLTMNLIIKKDNGKQVRYSLNDNYDTWKPISKRITLSKKITTVIKNDNEGLSQMILSKDNNSKENIPKENGDALYRSIIKDLNRLSNKNFDYRSKNNRTLIDHLLKQGFTFADFEHVHNIKSREWLRDKKMEKFLRPKTLYKPDNFESYLNEKN